MELAATAATGSGRLIAAGGHCRTLTEGNAGIERDLPPVDPGDGQSQRLAARKGRLDYLLAAAEIRLGRRTALTFPLLPPPQKN